MGKSDPKHLNDSVHKAGFFSLFHLSLLSLFKMKALFIYLDCCNVCIHEYRFSTYSVNNRVTLATQRALAQEYKHAHRTVLVVIPVSV